MPIALSDLYKIKTVQLSFKNYVKVIIKNVVLVLKPGSTIFNECPLKFKKNQHLFYFLVKHKRSPFHYMDEGLNI
jgi:hypothetical protein